MYARTHLVSVDPRIRSAYPIGAARERLSPLVGLRSGKATPDTAAALAVLNEQVQAAGGDMRWTDLLRESGDQARARKMYETWLAAGKPAPGTPSFIPSTMKAAFVALPGGSFHEAGRAGDADHLRAAPASVPHRLKLDWLWSIAIPLGFRPAIKAADEGAKEAWHLDYPGCWSKTLDHIGYAQAAKAAILDVGKGWDVIYNPEESFIQAQLHRAGYHEIGAIDGVLGPKTREVLRCLGMVSYARLAPVCQATMELPDEK